MSQGPLCPNLSQKVQKEVSQMANRNLSCHYAIRWFGLSVNLNHLKIKASISENHFQICSKLGLPVNNQRLDLRTKFFYF